MFCCVFKKLTSILFLSILSGPGRIVKVTKKGLSVIFQNDGTFLSQLLHMYWTRQICQRLKFLRKIYIF